MNQLIAFDFETNNVRVVMDTQMQPWFVAADVCAALTINTEQTRRLDHDEKGLRIVQTPGGLQDMTVINESGLYSLILTSRKAEAKRFTRWVTHDVLPSIRKTGGYAAPGSASALRAPTQDKVNALLAIGEAISRVPGVKHGFAMAATLTAIFENTGLAVDAMRKSLPAANMPICSLIPTQLGQRLGIPGRDVNLRLHSLGMQFKNERDEWELTPSGQKWAEALPFSRNGHSGYQILWNPAVLQMIRNVA